MIWCVFLGDWKEWNFLKSFSGRGISGNRNTVSHLDRLALYKIFIILWNTPSRLAIFYFTRLTSRRAFASSANKISRWNGEEKINDEFEDSVSRKSFVEKNEKDTKASQPEGTEMSKGGYMSLVASLLEIKGRKVYNPLYWRNAGLSARTIYLISSESALVLYFLVGDIAKKLYRWKAKPENL